MSPVHPSSRLPTAGDRAATLRQGDIPAVDIAGERLTAIDVPKCSSPQQRVRGRSGDGVGCAPPVGDTAPLDTVAIKPRRAPRRPGQPNKPSPHRSVTVGGGVNPWGERLFGVDRPAVTGGADQSPRGESMRVRGRSGDGVGCAPPVGDTAPLDTVAIKPRRAPRRPGQPNKPSPHRSVTVGGVNPRGERLFGVDRPAVTGGADQSPRGESMRVRGRSGDGIGYAPPVGDTAPLDTVAIQPRRAPRQPGQPNKPSPHRSVTVGADQSPRGESMRARGRSGDGVGCAPPVGDTAPLDTWPFSRAVPRADQDSPTSLHRIGV